VKVRDLLCALNQREKPPGSTFVFSIGSKSQVLACVMLDVNYILWLFIRVLADPVAKTGCSFYMCSFFMQ